MTQPLRTRPRLWTGGNCLLGQSNSRFLRSRSADEAARVAEDAVRDPSNPRKLLLLQAAPRFGQGQSLAEGVELRRDGSAIPGCRILIRIDDEEKVAQSTLEDSLFPGQFMIENDDPGVPRLSGSGQHGRLGLGFRVGLPACPNQNASGKIGRLEERVVIGLVADPGGIEGFDQEGKMPLADGRDSVVGLIDGKDEADVDILPDRVYQVLVDPRDEFRQGVAPEITPDQAD